MANQVIHTDLNMLTVLFYAVQALRVRHIIVCGHYGCGGVKAATSGRDFGLINRWLQNIKDCAERHQDELLALPTRRPARGGSWSCNVIEQVDHLAKTSVVQPGLEDRGAPLAARLGLRHEDRAAEGTGAADVDRPPPPGAPLRHRRGVRPQLSRSSRTSSTVTVPRVR